MKHVTTSLVKGAGKFCLLLFLFPPLHAGAKELELKTTITDVTVFQTGAQVLRTGSITIPSGEYDIVVRDATSLLKKESLLVKGDGDFTILSVNHQADVDDQEMNRDKWKSLEDQQKDLMHQMQDLSIKIEVLRTEENTIMNMQSVSTSTEGITVADVTKAQDLLQQKLSRIKNDKLVATRDMKALVEKYRDVTKELAALKIPKQSISYKIVIHVSAKADTKGKFDITYIVPNAKWYPSYDIRVKTVADPMQIEYKANVTQQTGEDWNNVKMKLSTGDPSQSSKKPNVETWLLHLNESYKPPVTESNYYRYSDAQFTKVSGIVMNKATGEPLPFCSVIVYGTSIGASTDVNGAFNILLPQGAKKLKFTLLGFEPQVLDITGENMKVYLQANTVDLEEVEIVNGGTSNKDDEQDYAPVTGWNYNDETKTKFEPVPNVVSTEFTISEKYTIPSDPANIMVTIQTIQTNAGYQYYCAPRLDKDVFLTAQVIDWEKFNLLEGQANVFFEGTFIGNTLLDTRYLKDTLEISLGRDKSVKVERIKSKEFNKRQRLGGDNIAYRQWDITARNGKQEGIDIIIEDQFPVSSDSRIDVKREEKSDGKLDDKTGIVTWKYTLAPSTSKSMVLKYSVKFPKGNFVGLD